MNNYIGAFIKEMKDMEDEDINLMQLENEERRGGLSPKEYYEKYGTLTPNVHKRMNK